MPRFALTLEYDGTDFSGWQIQEGQRTVQGELEKALAVMLRETIAVTGASRTDAGVHAEGQVASFTTEQEVLPARLIRSLSALMQPAIAVVDARIVNDDFNPRFAAIGKHYVYRILNRSAPSPLFQRTAWHVPQKFNLEHVRVAAAKLIGTHDFGGFRAADCQRVDTVRTITELRVETIENGMIEFHVKGTGFMKYMVRIIAGTLSDIGRGVVPVEAVDRALETRDRSFLGQTAPAHGLTLVRVFFND